MLKRLQKALRELDIVLCDVWKEDISDEDLQRMWEEIDELEKSLWQSKLDIECKMKKEVVR